MVSLLSEANDLGTGSVEYLAKSRTLSWKLTNFFFFF